MNINRTIIILALCASLAALPSALRAEEALLAGALSERESVASPEEFSVEKDEAPGTETELKKLTLRGVNARNRRGETPLMLASRLSDRAAAEALLKDGAQVNAVSRSGATALMNAALYSGDPQLIRLLLDAGASVNAADRNGVTPLMMALYGPESEEAALALLSAGADMNAKDKAGRTPLMFACRADRPVSFLRRLLHEYRAQAGAETKGGVTVMMYAAQYASDAAVLQALYSAGGETVLPGKGGENVLHFAGRNRTEAAPEIMKFLIGRRAPLEQKSSGGWTPLMTALQAAENTDAVKELLQAGASVNAKKNDGVTPLMIAAANSYGCSEALVRLLIEAGADPGLRDNAGRNAWHTALRTSPSAKTAQYLQAMLPLSEAREQRLQEQASETAQKVIAIAQKMNALSAPPQNESVEGPLTPNAAVLPGDADAENQEREIAAGKAGAPTPAEKEALPQKQGNGKETVREETDGTLPEDPLNAGGQVTPLMLAAVNPNEASADIIKALLAQGEDLEAREEKGRTALVCAVRYNRTPFAALALIEAGANTAARWKGCSLSRLLRMNGAMSAADKKLLAPALTAR